MDGEMGLALLHAASFTTLGWGFVTIVVRRFTALATFDERDPTHWTPTPTGRCMFFSTCASSTEQHRERCCATFDR
jgi:hypothetical protein